MEFWSFSKLSKKWLTNPINKPTNVNKPFVLVIYLIKLHSINYKDLSIAENKIMNIRLD